MHRRWKALLGFAAIAGVAAVVALHGFSYAYLPSQQKVVSRTRRVPYAFDLFGEKLTAADVERRQLTAARGLVPLDSATAKSGREEFYKTTFGNELFLTDVMGILDGPLRVPGLLRALVELNGRGTTDLVVPCPEDTVIGNRRFRKGEPLHTGIDVPRGSWAPLGLPVSFRDGRIRAGITCAACHATVDLSTGKVIEGASNQDLNAGLLLALATNSAAFYMHTDVQPQPDAAAFEKAVDEALLQWPPGSFDSMVDMKEAPTRIPISWTWNNHPYSWSGAFAVGPFRGLSAQNNNVHALNSDSLVLADGAPALFGMSKDDYIALILRNAANPHFRWTPQSGKTASEFFRGIDPNPDTPGLNELVLPSTFPSATPLGPDGTFTSTPGRPFWQSVNAMSVWQHTLVPPKSPVAVTGEEERVAREVFIRAGCGDCHSGSFLTDNKVHRVSEVGTEPTRAQALKKTEQNFALPVLFGFNEPVPLRREAKGLPVPMVRYDSGQIALAWDHRGSGGGYKTPALIGLNWRAPYLHEGGVAVGPHGESGLTATLGAGLAPDPLKSLLALMDRDEREKVVRASRADPRLIRAHITGAGHEFWIDAKSGFTPDEQRAVATWLLTVEP